MTSDQTIPDSSEVTSYHTIVCSNQIPDPVILVWKHPVLGSDQRLLSSGTSTLVDLFMKADIKYIFLHASYQIMSAFISTKRRIFKK